MSSFEVKEVHEGTCKQLDGITGSPDDNPLELNMPLEDDNNGEENSNDLANFLMGVMMLHLLLSKQLHVGLVFAAAAASMASKNNKGKLLFSSVLATWLVMMS